MSVRSHQFCSGWLLSLAGLPQSCCSYCGYCQMALWKSLRLYPTMKTGDSCVVRWGNPLHKAPDAENIVHANIDLRWRVEYYRPTNVTANSRQDNLDTAHLPHGTRNRLHWRRNGLLSRGWASKKVFRQVERSHETHDCRTRSRHGAPTQTWSGLPAPWRQGSHKGWKVGHQERSMCSKMILEWIRISLENKLTLDIVNLSFQYELEVLRIFHTLTKYPN